MKINFKSLLLGLTVMAPLVSQAELMWGVNGHPYSAYPNITIQQQLDQVKLLGAKSYRVNLTTGVKPATLQLLVDEAKARGIEILPIFPGAGSLANDSEEVLYKKAYDFAFPIVTAMKGQIRVYELGNEMENFAIIKACEMQDNGKQYNCAWGPAGGVTRLEYYTPRWKKVSAVLKGFSDAVVKADPAALKAMGTAGWGHTGAFDRMADDGIKWDISVWHQYGQDPEWAFKKLVLHNKPIWVTEFNHSNGSMTDGETNQAAGLVAQMKRLRELEKTYNIQAAHVYELLDESYWTGFEAYMGLINIKKNAAGKWELGNYKPGFAAVQKEIEVNKSLDLNELRFTGLVGQSTPQSNLTALTIANDGKSLKLVGNHWAVADFHYEVTEKTVMEFDVNIASATGEIYGIGLAPSKVDISKVIQFSGKHTFGIQTFRSTVKLGELHVKIEFSKIPKIRGNMDQIYFVCDQDNTYFAGGDITFKNVKIYEAP